jgi:hypothetical protein
VGSERPDSVLADKQPCWHRSAVVHQEILGWWGRQGQVGESVAGNFPMIMKAIVTDFISSAY